MPNWLKKLYARSSAIWKYFLLPVLITLGLACGPVDEEAEANKRFVEAVALLETAEGESAAPAKLALLEQAETTFQTIITRYPSTTLAVKLASGQQIGNVSLATVATAVEAARGPACQVAPTSACVIAQALALAQTLDGWQRSQALHNIIRALAGIAPAQAQTGNRAGAQAALAQALVLAQTLPGEEDRCRMLARIAPAQAQTGNRAGAQAALAQALALAQTLLDEEDRKEIIVTLEVNGRDYKFRLEVPDDFTEAGLNRWIEESVEIQSLINSSAPQEKGEITGPPEIAEPPVPSLYVTLLSLAQAQAGDRVGAQATLARVLALVQTLDEKERTMTLALAAPVQAQVGDHAEAYKATSQALAFVQTLDEKERNRTLSLLSVHLIDAGDVVQALAFAQTITGGEDRAKTLAFVAQAQAQTGDLTGSQETVSQALALARTLDEKERVDTLAEIVPALAQAGDHAEVQATLAWVLARTQMIGEWPRTRILAHITQAQAYMGDGVQALALAQTITLEGPRVRALADIALALTRVAASDAPGTDFWNWVNSFW